MVFVRQCPKLLIIKDLGGPGLRKRLTIKDLGDFLFTLPRQRVLRHRKNL